MKFLLIVFLILESLTGGAPAFALSDDELGQRQMLLNDEFRCPTCQGLSVKDSSSAFSTQIKDKITHLLKEGKSDQEIRDYFVERYGVWILREPPKSGFNLLLWILPGAGILVGFLWVFRKFRQWAKNPPATTENQLSPLTEEEQKILDADLKRFENS